MFAKGEENACYPQVTQTFALEISVLLVESEMKQTITAYYCADLFFVKV